MLDECRRECALVTVDLDERSRWPRLIKHVGGKVAASESTLLVAFRGSRIGGEMRRPREDAIRVLAALYEAAASVDPKWEVVPLFEFCGWTRESIAERYVVSTTYAEQEACAKWNEAAFAGATHEVVPSDAIESLDDDDRKRSVETCLAEPRCEGCAAAYTSMDQVCVGGTFDRLHAGHRLLLAATVAVCDEIIFVGITDDALLAKKRNRELLEPFDRRRDEVEAFIRKMNPNLKVAVGCLDDVSRAPMPRKFEISATKEVAAGPLDASRPGAVTTESMRGIVVSRETVAGARWINRERKSTENYPELAIVAVNLVGAASQDPKAKKLSSSDLRDREAARKRRNVSQSSSGEKE